MIKFILLLSALSTLVSAVAFAGYYEERNLAELSRHYSKRKVESVPWVGWWWPYDEGGTTEGMAKIDTVLGYNDWIAGWERAYHGYPTAAHWWGHCNGWATAAIMEREPRASKNIAGVNFTVGDRKSILSEYWMEVGADFIGMRVWNENDTSSASFWDVSPAQFHLLMSNIVGREGRSMIIDRHTGAEVWNQPLVAYEVAPIHPEDYLGPDSNYSNVFRVNVTTTMYWATDEVEDNDLTPVFNWETGKGFEKRTLRYELWLDAPPVFDSKGGLVSSGDIIITSSGTGGAWKNGSTYRELVHSHPDFMWIPLSYAGSSGYKNPRLDDAWVQQNITN